jgi:hypothetical protein
MERRASGCRERGREVTLNDKSVRRLNVVNLINGSLILCDAVINNNGWRATLPAGVHAVL